MEKFETGAVRDTGGKGRFDLLPWCAIWRVAKHMEDAVVPDPVSGAPHYPERNWEKGLPIHSMVDSAFRHLAKYAMGMVDEDHLCAAATNLLMAMWTEENKPEMQDIPAVKQAERTKEEPTRKPGNEKLGMCSSFMPNGYVNGDIPRCSGTKECDPCMCGGDPRICSFYPEKRGEESK